MSENKEEEARQNACVTVSIPYQKVESKLQRSTARICCGFKKNCKNEITGLKRSKPGGEKTTLQVCLTYMSFTHILCVPIGKFTHTL